MTQAGAEERREGGPPAVLCVRKPTRRATLKASRYWSHMATPRSTVDIRRGLSEPRPHARCQPPQRWVGLGVIADNLINVGLAIGKQSAK